MNSVEKGAVGRPREFVAYYRVSTRHQELSRLGLEAQRNSVRRFLASNPGSLIAEFEEALSGRKNVRPQLQEAMRVCRMRRAVLLVAHLDRLSRNVGMITELMESGLEFVAADFPEANRFTIHVLAAIAEYESNLFSERMKAAMAAAKARGTKLGGWRGHRVPGFPPGAREASARTKKARAQARAKDLAPIFWGLVAEGKSRNQIADEFNRRGIPTPRRRRWHASSLNTIVRHTWPDFDSKPEVRVAEETGPRWFNFMRRVREIGPLMRALRRDGKSYDEISDELARRKIEPPRKGRWAASSISRYLRLANKMALPQAPALTEASP
jgi:DNA invertase Pin-like site-specific DNA recombinase